MVDTKLIFKEIVANAINEFVKEKEIQTEPITTEQIVVQTTPDASMGDLGVPMFVFAKTFRMAPPAIASGVVSKINDTPIGEILAVGPYVNIKLNKELNCITDSIININDETTIIIPNPFLLEVLS